MSKTHIASDETLARVATALEVMAGQRTLTWDEETGRYTNDSVAAMLAGYRTGLAYGVTVPKSAVVACTKTGANAGMAAPVPGTVGTPAVDPYTMLGPFVHIDVNGGVDPDGTPYVTAVEGDARFRRDGSNGDVWVMAPVIYGAESEDEDSYTLSVSDTRLAGMEPRYHAELPDGTLRPYLLFAKYQGCEGADGYMHSYSGQPVWKYTLSHDDCIAACRNATTGYSALAASDRQYLQEMMLLKYATKDMNLVMYGCLAYNLHYHPTVAEQCVTRVILASADAANLVVGSSVALGTDTDTSDDRARADVHDVLTAARILAIEEYDASNSAVYLEVAEPFDVETTYLLSTMPWSTGSTDEVEGDGCMADPTSGVYPLKCQGIEAWLGTHEVLGNVLVASDGQTGHIPHVNHDSRNEATSVTSDYVSCADALPLNAETSNAHRYPTHASVREGLVYGTDTTGSQTTGLCDSHYVRPQTSTATSEWLCGGALSHARAGGPCCVYAHRPASARGWGVGSRLSALGRSRG